MAIVAACVFGVPGMLTVGVFATGSIMEAFTEDDTVPASQAGCLDDMTMVADDRERWHVETGRKVDYTLTPPAFGRHWPNYLQGAEIRSFYTVADRPEVERLVHSLEHGYTILWYDAQTELAARAVADGAGPKFIAAPWTSADGGALGDGIHAVLVHWSAGGAKGEGMTPAAVEEGTAGVWRKCAQISREVVDDFLLDYPYTDSLEPQAP